MSHDTFGKRGTFRVVLAAMLFAVAAACGGGSDKAKTPDVASSAGEVVQRSPKDRVAARQREQRRQKALDAQAQEFSYFRYRIDTSADQPLACLVFSAALDPKTDYSPFVEFRPAFRPALSVEGRELCIGGLTFGTSRTATILSGLPAADGRTLKGEETVAIDFADRPPYVGFKGAGVILPREDADGLPIETVNVDKVKITVSRINDRALAFKSISEGETSAQGRYSYSWGEDDPSDVEAEIWSGTMEVPSEQNAPVISVFPLQDVIGTLEPGAYYVRVTDAAELNAAEGPPASSSRWIMLTDLAITAYEGENGLDVTLRSLQDGKPVPDTDVQLVAMNNEILAETRSNEQGRVAFDKPIISGQGNLAPRMLLAFSAKGELAALDLTRAPVDLSEHAVGGRRTPGLVDAYVYTDRGIYRPGETVEISALLRDRTGRQISSRAGNLVIYRPNGLVATKVRFDDPESGAVLNGFDLPRGASRGQWRAVIEMDGMAEPAGTARFSVEDFVPQRIAVDLTGDDKTPIKVGGSVDLSVASRFLYGAPGAGLTVKSEARIEPQQNPFPAFDGFEFGRHDATFEERIVELPDQTTDGAGNATVRVAPGSAGSNAGRPLRINAVVSVLEPGGRAVTESLRVPYRPESLYIGLKPGFEDSVDEGGDSVFQVVAVNSDGVAVGQRLKWKMLAIDYHYDWYRDGDEWRWRRSRTVTKANEGVVTTPAGGTAEIKVSGLEWGSHELVVEAEGVNVGAQASNAFYVGWGGRVSGDGVEAPDRVRVIGPDKSPSPGQTAVMTIIPPYDGQAQIVVATDTVLSVQNLAVTAAGTRVTLPVTDAWGEGAYVMVNVYTQRDPILQAKPRRAVGVVNVPVNMDARTFALTIAAPKVARPRGEQVVEVSFGNGPREPVFLTLAAVDEGILQLTKFKSPDPVSYYYGQKALGVELYDDYGRLLDPNMGLPAEVRTGGDQLGGEGLTVVPTKSVALFSGLVDVGRSGKAKIRFDVPDFNGELRLMAVAWSKTGLGSGESKMTVRDEAPSEMILPRFLAPGDEAFLTASIDNVELPAGEFRADITGSGPLTVADSHFRKTLPTGQRSDAPVRVDATTEGISQVRMAVTGPNKFAVTHTYDIQTRSPYLPETRSTSALMQPGDEYAIDPKLLAGYIPGSVDVTVGYSSIPVDPATLYASLDRYPYGCTEQTVSRALPLLYSEQLVAMGARGTRDNARDRIQTAVNTLLNRQSADGAFGLWREGDGNASPWLGAYVTDFVYRAKAEGYEVPAESLDRAYGALRAISTGDQWRVYGYDTDVYESRYSNDTAEQMMYRASAYSLYVLAKAGEADISRLRYLHDRELPKINSPLARAQIGAGLALLGDRSRATSAFESAEKALGYTNTGDYYQTPLRDVAGVMALASEADMAPVVARLAEKLGKDVPDADTLTTQEKAFILLAVNDFNRGENAFRLVVEGLGRNKDNQRQYLISEEQVASGVTFKLEGKAPMFRTVMVTGAPEKAPPAASSKLKVDKTYFTMTGGKVDLSRVNQGDQLVVRLTVTPEERRLNPVIVADLLPAGFEIETVLKPADGKRTNNTSGAFAFVGEIAQAQSEQAQDDRFVAAVDVYGDAKTLAYVVRAVTAGDFAMPGVVAEDMYRPAVYARSRPGRVVITGAPGTTAGGK
ncbi:alpha-2-macroglobulin family protein [Hyphomonas johnsonii]|uniref:Alpha-2-macroglobulin family protein n=1 Tax=Hyphomonas johnsonii MHS-2 TaxID=1280950 RepID=A0A059FJL4_9PROT|nr:alpha-2-macroglobulin [Hyphomonas johnsonii]KCZ90663.1 alpha-2-macroglobulin family protein [Hyphomonas johnsonii MHS-2]